MRAFAIVNFKGISYSLSLIHIFKDVPFLLINDKLQAVFDLARMGSEVNWKELLDNLGDFGKRCQQMIS